MSEHTKITSSHLHRAAFVYVRQSSAAQNEYLDGKTALVDSDPVPASYRCATYAVPPSRRICLRIQP
jgi:hypothetical protein